MPHVWLPKYWGAFTATISWVPDTQGLQMEADFGHDDSSFVSMLATYQPIAGRRS